MPFGWDDFGGGVLGPAVIALGVFLVWRVFGSRSGAERFAAAHAVAAGFLTAWLLFDWAKIPPAEHWQWLPWLGLAAAATGPAAAAEGVRWIDRAALRIALGFVAAYALVPTWTSLADSRVTHVAIFGAALALLCLLLERLPVRVGDATLAWALCASAGVGAIVLAVSHNLKFAQLGGAAAAALGGCAAGTLVLRREARWHGGTDVFVVLVAGLLYAGWLGSFSEVPVASFVLPAIAPACLGGIPAGAFARRSPAAGFGVRIAVVGIPLAVAVVWALVAEPIEAG